MAGRPGQLLQRIAAWRPGHHPNTNREHDDENGDWDIYRRFEESSSKNRKDGTLRCKDEVVPSVTNILI